MQESNSLIVRHFSRSPYTPIWEAMQRFTTERDANTPDELWLLEHEPVFTQGLAGKAEHILSATTIPIVQTDRGGQVTYHGLGQLMAYCLWDIRRLGLHTRDLVMKLEQTVIDLLHEFNIHAHGNREAPGVYVNDKKIGSMGLRVKRGYCYHGICLNVAGDLLPFQSINPCGYSGLQMVQMADFVPDITLKKVIEKIAPCMQKQFGYSLPSSIEIT